LDLGELHRTRQSFGALSALALDVALPALVLVVTNVPAGIDSSLNLSERFRPRGSRLRTRPDAGRVTPSPARTVSG